MLILITGAPGTSKTSHAIDRFYDVKIRPIFYYNIPLNDAGKSQLGWIEFTQDQVLNWDKELPPNAILIVDECQRIWPVRSAAKSVPASCSAMETHRHLGVDIVLITQHAGLIDSHIRKLVNEHYHYSRPFGMPFAIEYHSGSGVVATDTKSGLADCTSSKKKLPKRVWPLYKSAEVHTHKAKIPKVFYFVIFAALAAVFLIYRFVSGFGGSSDQPVSSDSSYSDSSFVESAGSSNDDMPWVELLTPEIEGIPYTAPLYRELATQVRSVPRVAGCILVRDRCQCYTQQGTSVAGVSESLCARYLVSNSFNHMRADSENINSNEYQHPRAVISAHN